MKYIVYKTTNLINNFIYIGVHKTANPEVFDHYLGCGVYDNKSNTYLKAKTCFQQAVAQFGPKNFYREVLAAFTTPEEAYALEGLLVNKDFLARNDVYNTMLGGNINYALGRKVYQYDLEGNYITEYNSCADASRELKCDDSVISHSIIYRFQVKGFCFDYEKKSKLDMSLYNFHIPIQVHRYLKSGQYDKTYTSLNAAEVDTDASTSYIQKAATLGYLVKDSYYFSFYKFDSYDKARSYHILHRSVYKYDQNGNYKTSYDTQEQAEKENPGCNITNSIKLRCPDCNGNYWAIVKIPIYNKPEHQKAKRVAQVDQEGNILKTWESSNLCAKEVGVAIKNVLRGKYNLHKGYKYIYIE